MERNDLEELKNRIASLTEEEKKERDKYLRALACGEIQGPPVGYASIDKQWLKWYREDVIDENLPSSTVYEYLYMCNKDHLNRIALSYYGKKITFDELFKNIDIAAAALESYGLKEGDIVTISLPNIPEAVYLFYACSKLGIVANMVDPRTSEEGIKKYINEVDSKLVIIVDSYFNKVKGLLEEGKIDTAIAVSPAESLPRSLYYAFKAKEFVDQLKDSTKKIEFNDKVLSWKSFNTLGTEYYQIHKNELKHSTYRKDRPLVIEHTGGTTGNPKGVVLSDDNINAVAVQSVMTDIDMKREHNWLDIMPTFIAYGVAMGLHLPLTIGMETILIPQFDADKFDELLLKHKPNHMVGVPSYWGTIINSKKLAKKDLSFIIAPTVGGDSMDTSLEQKAKEYLNNHNCDYPITKGYGMTEVAGGVSGTVDASNLIGSVGIPFAKTTIAVFDSETGEELYNGEDGEICITGPNVMLGYFNNEEETSKVIKEHSDGTKWVHSGDIGHIDKDGNLFIVDRIKRIIIRYDGFKIFPSLIEKVVSENKAVKACKVIGIDDTQHSQGKLPKVHIVLKDEYKNLENAVLEEIKESCEATLPEYSLPVDYKIRDDMPLTPIGKIDYRKLEEEEKEELINIKK